MALKTGGGLFRGGRGEGGTPNAKGEGRLCSSSGVKEEKGLRRQQQWLWVAQQKEIKDRVQIGSKKKKEVVDGGHHSARTLKNICLMGKGGDSSEMCGARKERGKKRTPKEAKKHGILPSFHKRGERGRVKELGKGQKKVRVVTRGKERRGEPRGKSPEPGKRGGRLRLTKGAGLTWSTMDFSLRREKEGHLRL